MTSDAQTLPAVRRAGGARIERPVLCPTLVPATLGLAFSLALSADTLLRDGLGGAAFPVWVAMTVVGLAWLAWRAGLSVSREAAGWLAAAVFFSFGLAWRDSEVLQAFDFLATFGTLLLAAASLDSPHAVLFAPRLRTTARAALSSLGSAASGFAHLVFRDAAAHHDSKRWSVVGQRTLRIALVAAALTLIFGSLLSSADPIFASFVALPSLDASALLRHTLVVVLLTWGIGGWARGALIEKTDSANGVGVRTWQLDTLDITTAFVTLIVLFGGFIVAQLGWLFGGEAFLRARTGLTAATYARKGFFQMVWVVALVIPLLVATRSALRPGRALARRHTALALPVVALLGAIILSAALRMRLYVHYYGLSTDRVYPLVFMAWLGFVLVWLSATTLRGRSQCFGPGIVLSALGTLAGLNVVVPDVVVARVNVARSIADVGLPLDSQYLSSLSGEAAEWAVQAILDDARRARATPVDQHPLNRCATLNGLLGRWGAISPVRASRTQPGAWRSWNAGEAHALRVVARREAELEAAQREACVRAKVAAPQG